MKLLVLIVVLTSIAAPRIMAQAPAPTNASLPLDPVGRYSFEVQLPDGSVAPGSVEIKGDKGIWTGTITSATTPPTPMDKIRVEGNTLHFQITAPNGQAFPMAFTFTGDRFTGQITFGGITIPVTGKREVP